jgi:murein L,D-transpeptidase YcbB/YkuD
MAVLAQSESFGRRSARARFIAAALGLFVAAGGATADDSSSWFQFTSATAHGDVLDQPFDRALGKQWESNPPKGHPTLDKGNVAALNAAVKRYEAIVAAGGWPTALPDPPKSSAEPYTAVVQLRQRMTVEGDLKSSNGGDAMDLDLERALKRFQVRHGLTPSGKADKATVAALNVPAPVRLKQLKANQERLRSLVAGVGSGRYIFVNIPSAQIEAVEGGKVVSRHAGVVGKTDRPTPVLKSAIHELNFNPVWHLPPTVIQKDLIPRGREMARSGKDILVKHGIDAYDGNGRKIAPEKINWSSNSVQNLTYRQNPGADNPMGFVKINFHNSYSVYMHDTPAPSIFGRNFRAASSGCVRVMNITDLVTWILAGQDGWSGDKVSEIKASGERKDVRLKKPVPLIFGYVTAWATEDGMVHFRRDLYRRDGVGMTASAY